MIALYIAETRPFMASLLTGNIFDRLLLREGQITTFCTYSIDGNYHASYMDDDSEDPSPVYASWEMLKPHIYDMIKGKHTPLGFKFVFQLSSNASNKLLTENGLAQDFESLNALFLNIRFDGKRIMLTTGSSQKAFPANKNIDHAWDQYIYKFLKANHFEYDAQ